jgi:hypothetical protein
LGQGGRRPFSWRRIFGQMSCSSMRKMDGAALAWSLPVTGTLGILERGAERGPIDLPSTLARLLNTSFRVRGELVQAMLARDAARKRPM